MGSSSSSQYADGSSHHPTNLPPTHLPGRSRPKCRHLLFVRHPVSDPTRTHFGAQGHEAVEVVGISIAIIRASCS
jgi:hypothetical protein